MQTILGSGGAIGNELAMALPKFTDTIRLVSRNPVRVNAGDELFSCDLLDGARVLEAVKGSDVVYLTAGLVYKRKVWEAQWPVVIRNVIAACKHHNSKLVFFDNIYMIDAGHIGNITEDSPVNPPSKKGKIRAEIDQMILDEVKAGSIRAIIARAADFYGPRVNSSVLLETVYKNLMKGKPANWFCRFDKVHSFTYTPDAGRATAILGNDPGAFNQIWNLPTAASPMTGAEWIDAFANEMKVKARRQLATPFIIRVMGLFIPVMREFIEMLYQFDRDYVFHSAKFEKAYDFKPTSYLEGIREIVAADKNP